MRMNRSDRVRRLSVWLFAFLAVCLMGLAMSRTPALAATLSSTASWEPRSMTEGGDVTVSVTVNNTTGDITAEGVTLLRDGQTLASGGTVAPGESTTLTAVITLTTEELGQPIALELAWTENGEAQSGRVSITVSKYNPTPSVKFTRKVSSESVVPGGEVVITYTVTNVGDVDITDISITDNFGVVAETDILPVGSNTWVATKTLRPDKAFSTEPVLTYNVGEYTYNNKANPDSITVRITPPTMSVKLEADAANLAEGDAVTLVGTLSNTGAVPFTSISVQATNLGEIYTARDLAVGATRSFSQKTVIAETTVFKLTVTARDASGNTYTFTSDPVTVNLVDTPAPVSLELYAASDMLQLTSPTDVRFSLTIKNSGRDPLEGVRVTDQEGRLVAEFQYCPTGSQDFGYTMHISEAVNVVFTASVADPSTGEEVRISTPPIIIAYNSVTATLAPELLTPAPTDIPDGEAVTLPAAPEDASPDDTEKEGIPVYVWVLAVLFVVLAVLVVLLVMAADRENRRSRSRRGAVRGASARSRRPVRGHTAVQAGDRSRYDSPSARAARAGIVGAARAAEVHGIETEDDLPDIPVVEGGTQRFSAVAVRERIDSAADDIVPLTDTTRFTSLKMDDWGDVDMDDLGTTLSGDRSFRAVDLPLADDDINWDDTPPADYREDAVTDETVMFTPQGRR